MTCGSGQSGKSDRFGGCGQLMKVMGMVVVVNEVKMMNLVVVIKVDQMTG